MDKHLESGLCCVQVGSTADEWTSALHAVHRLAGCRCGKSPNTTPATCPGSASSSYGGAGGAAAASKQAHVLSHAAAAAAAAGAAGSEQQTSQPGSGSERALSGSGGSSRLQLASSSSLPAAAAAEASAGEQQQQGAAVEPVFDAPAWWQEAVLQRLEQQRQAFQGSWWSRARVLASLAATRAACALQI